MTISTVTLTTRQLICNSFLQGALDINEPRALTNKEIAQATGSTVSKVAADLKILIQYGHIAKVATPAGKHKTKSWYIKAKQEKDGSLIAFSAKDNVVAVGTKSGAQFFMTLEEVKGFIHDVPLYEKNYLDYAEDDYDEDYDDGAPPETQEDVDKAAGVKRVKNKWLNNKMDRVAHYTTPRLQRHAQRQLGIPLREAREKSWAELMDLFFDHFSAIAHQRDCPKKLKPEVFFQFFKTTLTETQLTEVTKDLQKLQAMLNAANIAGQTALFESLSNQVEAAIRERQVHAIRCSKYVMQSDVEKLRNLLKDAKTVKLVDIENYPRVIPPEALERFSEVKASNVFDGFKVLYTDTSGEEKKLTTAQKIRKKDPILWGTLKAFPGRLFFVVDWEDEFCTLTMMKMIDHLRENDTEYLPSEIPEVDDDYLQAVIQRSRDGEKRLATTGVDNWRDMENEQIAADQEAIDREATGSEVSKLASLFQDVLQNMLDKPAKEEKFNPDDYLQDDVIKARLKELRRKHLAGLESGDDANPTDETSPDTSDTSETPNE